jgi:hypothetical protein
MTRDNQPDILALALFQTPQLCNHAKRAQGARRKIQFIPRQVLLVHADKGKYACVGRIHSAKPRADTLGQPDTSQRQGFAPCTVRRDDKYPADDERPCGLKRKEPAPFRGQERSKDSQNQLDGRLRQRAVVLQVRKQPAIARTNFPEQAQQYSISIRIA